jgi:CRP-like cAMP-binding protein
MPNSLLAALPEGLLAQVMAQGEVTPLVLKRVLHEPDDPTVHVYFPLSGVISLLTVLDDGSAVEIATVGSEGMVDFGAYLGLESPARWLVQVPGAALRLEAKWLRDLADDSREVRDVMHSYMLSMFVLVSQTAACNRRHSVEERCARWLLMTHDRVEADTFPMTHEFLADMLGVRRPSVSIAMSILSRAGYMQYRRGKVEILDRDGLEEASCECYGVLSYQFQKDVSKLAVRFD